MISSITTNDHVSNKTLSVTTIPKKAVKINEPSRDVYKEEDEVISSFF